VDISLTKLPWHAQVGAFLALGLAGVGAFYNYYEVPLRADIETRQGQVKMLHADIDKGLATAKTLPEFSAQVKDLEGRLTMLRSVLPEEKDVADLLRRMQTLAMQSNLTITGFKPSPIVTKELHVEWPISLELEGNYHNLATFFDRLGKFTRIVNISGLELKGREKAAANNPNDTISASCVATTFVLLEKPQAKPGAKAAGKPASKKVA